MSSSASIVQILWRYKQREELTIEELAELRLWLMESPTHEELFDDLSNAAKWDREIAKWQTKDPNAAWNKILQGVEAISPEAFKKKKEWGRYMVAASVMLVLFASGIYMWLGRKQIKSSSDIVHQSKSMDIQPATSTAILTLGNGKVVPLDSLSTGTHTRQGNTDIIKTDSEALTYQPTAIIDGDIKYNTLSTAKGNQYQLVLSDGTKVWLNATSSLRFPVAFAGGTRTVELSGEAYFEVSKNKTKPFIVQVDHSTVIRVLGTHFNVDAYSDELVINATLMEGSISVSNGKDSAIIKPGEGVALNKLGEFSIAPANLEQVMAWRNKLFWFRKASFEEIMRQLSRWYDMDVKYQGGVKQSYTGILPGNLPLSNVLHILEKSGNVHFTIEDGNKVIVRP